jgi:hypothetical protein
LNGLEAFFPTTPKQERDEDQTENDLFDPYLLFHRLFIMIGRAWDVNIKHGITHGATSTFVLNFEPKVHKIKRKAGKKG